MLRLGVDPNLPNMNRSSARRRRGSRNDGSEDMAVVGVQELSSCCRLISSPLTIIHCQLPRPVSFSALALYCELLLAYSVLYMSVPLLFIAVLAQLPSAFT